MPKISVIVPIYKVENYLRACIDSILNQTFTDFEIILVDDGSPDNCGKICDDYAKKDNRVHVIHQENGGLSAARNAGIDWSLKNSSSNFLLFVDSDDLIKPDLLKTVIASQEKSQADIVCFGLEMVNEQLIAFDWGYTNIKDEEIFEYKQRFTPILLPKSVGDYAVNKLYKKMLFKNIRYPIGLTFEDIYTTYKIFDLAKSIYVIPNRFYIYRRRDKSITTKAKESNVIDFNLFLSKKEEYLFIKEKSPEYTENAIVEVVNAIFCIISHKRIDSNENHIVEMQNILNEEWSHIKDNKYLDSEKIKLCDKFRKSIHKMQAYLAFLDCKKRLTNKVFNFFKRLMIY